MTFVIQAPAKINLTLEVLSRRPDGYHTLRSLMVPLAFGDMLTIEESERPSFSCSDPALDAPDNLAARALRAIAPDRLFATHLIKRTPIQAGLGGGSSDAAAVLIAAMEGAFGPAISADYLQLARSLGSDVPFFLVGTGALVEGTGERVTAVGALPDWHVILVKPPVAISTAAAYEQIDRHPSRSRPRATSITLRALEALQRHDFQTVQSCLSNDFHEILARETPAIALVIDALHEAGARNALLCGSGSAVFSLTQSAAEVQALERRLSLPSDYTRIVTHFAPTPAWRSV